MKNKKITLFLVLIALIILVLDRLSKVAALQGAHEKNYGLLFGLFASAEFRWLFVAVIIWVLCFFIYVLLLEEVHKNKLLLLGLLLMMTGLLGNLLDRILYGFVVDFISLGNLTTFNLSDVSITAGSLIVLGYIFLGKKIAKK